jgi:ssDNA-binding Zn-finger/Zn-ribbon topoisomerase 1
LKKPKKKEFLGCTNWPKCHHVEWLDSKTKKSGDN